MESKRYTALGLMSGTSLDGVDAAIIETDGVEIFGFGDTSFSSFDSYYEGFNSENIRELLRKTIKASLDWGFIAAPPNILAEAERVVDAEHYEVITNLLQDGLSEDDFLKVDIIGYHGLTVLHHPAQNGSRGRTLQIGSGQVLSNALKTPVVYDFRTADVEAGGQGAPLAPIYHQALCRYSKLTGSIAIVNIGGVSNVTFIDSEKPLIATDCGPGNGPLDQWMWTFTDSDFDEDGQKSMLGNVDLTLIDKWFERDFFNRPMPRSADRYDFDIFADMVDKSLEDGAATLASFCAQSIARDLKAFNPETIIICGGGRHNPAIMGMIDMHTAGKVMKAEDVGWDGDALEAQAFAYLAVRSVRGLPISFPGTTGVPKPMTGGVLVHP